MAITKNRQEKVQRTHKCNRTHGHRYTNVTNTFCHTHNGIYKAIISLYIVAGRAKAVGEGVGKWARTTICHVTEWSHNKITPMTRQPKMPLPNAWPCMAVCNMNAGHILHCIWNCCGKYGCPYRCRTGFWWRNWRYLSNWFLKRKQHHPERERERENTFADAPLQLGSKKKEKKNNNNCNECTKR